MSHHATSIAAFHTAPLAPLRDRVFDVIHSHGAAGCIGDDVIAHFTKTDKTNTSAFTARFSELVTEGRIVRLGDTRIGASGKQQLVLRATEFTAGKTPAATRKAGKTGFLAGLMFAAKIVVKHEDMAEVKAELKRELLKAARRTT